MFNAAFLASKSEVVSKPYICRHSFWGGALLVCAIPLACCTVRTANFDDHRALDYHPNRTMEYLEHGRKSITGMMGLEEVAGETPVPTDQVRGPNRWEL